MRKRRQAIKGRSLHACIHSLYVPRLGLCLVTVTPHSFSVIRPSQPHLLAELQQQQGFERFLCSSHRALITLNRYLLIPLFLSLFAAAVNPTHPLSCLVSSFASLRYSFVILLRHPTLAVDDPIDDPLSRPIRPSRRYKGGTQRRKSQITARKVLPSRSNRGCSAYRPSLSIVYLNPVLYL